MIKILVVEDTTAIAELIHISLTRNGYHCTIAVDGGSAASLLEQDHYDLILLDIMLPEIDGYELMEYIEPMQIPVIFITAKGSLKDRVKGLQMGADDYIVKPFEIEELLARVQAVLRRCGKGQIVFSVEDVELDMIAHTVKQRHQEVSLTAKEFDLLVVKRPAKREKAKSLKSL